MGVLCFTESNGMNYFENLYSNNNFIRNNANYLKQNEENSLLCIDSNDKKILFIAGRQIVTLEKIEVLALGLKENYSDNKSIEEVINYILSKNALPVIPWGVGKWIGKRGAIVE